MTTVDATSFLVIVAFAAIAAVIVAALAPRLTLPVVVVELLLGIAIGPQGAGLADVDSFTNFFGNLGLGMPFFFAGYEIDFERIRGRPLELGLLAWAVSLVLPLVGMRLRHGRIEEAAGEGGLDELALERGGPATAPT